MIETIDFNIGFINNLINNFNVFVHVDDMLLEVM